jgi:hypothetical protein
MVTTKVARQMLLLDIKFAFGQLSKVVTIKVNHYIRMDELNR